MPAPAVPPPTPVPQPPKDPDSLDPLEYVWEAGRELVRCYDIGWGARDFYAGDATHRGRFHPFYPGRTRTPLKVLYAADEELGALSETVFHDVPVRGLKTVAYRKLVHRALIYLEPTRPLRLVDLTSDGLRRLELSRPELIESDPRSYPETATWAKALHGHGRAAGSPRAPFDGLTWVSRQRDTSRAVMLFGDRVDMNELDVVPVKPVVTLSLGRGLELVCDLADRADITVVGIP